jgi:hypothetical protein
MWTKPIFMALFVGLIALSILPGPSVARPKGLGAKGDDCTVHTNVPGKDNGDGECCSNSDPKDCVIILKPFPTGKALQKKP